MNTAITQGVKISVHTSFREDQSDAQENNFFFTYVIEIENRNPFTVQLISRHWRIVDSLDRIRYVDGAGVIGEQPLIAPGEVFIYSSGCDLISELGYMEGFYDFKQLDHLGNTLKTFRVKVPRFELIYPFKMN